MMPNAAFQAHACVVCSTLIFIEFAADDVRAYAESGHRRLQDPKFLAARIREQRPQIEDRYPDLIKALQLDFQAANRLLDLLARQEVLGRQSHTQ